MQDAPFHSDFAILDVKSGKAKLAKQINGGARVRVLVEMVLDRQHGSDDGVSIEFSGEVLSVKLTGTAA